MNESNKEIDLIELYQRILIFFVKNIKTFLVFIILGIIIGASYYYYTNDIINTHYVAEIDNTPKVLVSDLTEKIAFDIQSGNYESVSKQMNISEDIIKEIKKLSVDTNGTYLNIGIVSKSQESLSKFAEGLVYYYNNQAYIKNKFIAEKQKAKELNKIISQQIEKLKEIQEKVLTKETSSKVTINQMSIRQEDMISLYKMQQENEAILKRKSAISLVNLSDNLVKQKIV